MQRRNWPLFALMLLFITPFLTAYFILQDIDPLKLRTVQHGEFLFDTDIQFDLLQDFDGTILQSENLSNKWRVIYLQPQPCDAQCTAAKKVLRNVHAALGKDRTRVIFASGQMFNGNLDANPNILIIDPLGHCVMYYTAQHKPSGLLKDLRRLLKYSHAH
jgi:hypothetical protein